MVQRELEVPVYKSLNIIMQIQHVIRESIGMLVHIARV